ncbi:hypothetical protein BD779DRAFT_1448574 [Infundibulicybe gibba]|nr:hypothetical protein BD779DRAFT_1448574 [Infundibulicybe gibba]
MAPASASRGAPKLPLGTLKSPPRVRKHVHRSQVFDTNPSSYNRTDPFLAFNVLIKLLGSLTSRIGGCHLKFTPEEHKLSLHLLNIVEPFVGLSPSRRTIARQPTEVLDAIASHIDSKRDLLSLALSCQRMHGVIFPRHYEYRVVRCKVSSISVWNHLIVQRSLARNVRRLEILDERSSEPDLVPTGIMATDTDLESTDDELGLHDKHERYLVAALTKTTALTSFAWSCNHSPISIDNIWPTLLKCGSLREVDISDNLVFAPSPGTETSTQKTPVLHDMNAVALRSTVHHYGSTKRPVLSRITGMLDHCPNLQSLDITYLPTRSSTGPGTSLPPADALLLSGRWPFLTTLVLTNLHCSPNTGFDSASSFLAAHPNLEVLHLGISPDAHFQRACLAPNTLPRLRELKASKDIASVILACPTDAPRPLDTLKGIRLSGPHTPPNGRSPDSAFFHHIRNHARALRRVELTGWTDTDDVRRLAACAPGLTWLDVGKKLGGTQQQQTRGAPAPVAIANAVEWAGILTELPELIAFHGVRMFYEAPAGSAANENASMADRSRMKKNDEISNLLAWKCPKLRRLDHWDEGSGKVVVLLRDGGDPRDGEKDGKVRWEVRRVKQ